MQKTKKKAAILGVSVALALIAVLGTSFAWFVAIDSVTNRFETAAITDGSVEIVEVFDPPTDWVPGEEIAKEVSIVNHGNTAVLARVSFEEILYKLGNGGKEKALANAIPANGDIPVNMNISRYSNDWKTLSELGLTSTTVPDNATVMGKVVGGSGKNVYSFAMYQTSGLINQKMAADYNVSGNVLTISDVKYYYYDAKVKTEKDWAGENTVIPPGTPVTPQPLAKIAQTLSDSKISIAYSGDVTGVSAGEWFYNEADGYFYYIGKIEAGQNSTNFIDSIGLDASADNSYAMMEFNLIITLEAIQNTAEALGNTGWDITDASLKAVLEGYCN